MKKATRPDLALGRLLSLREVEGRSGIIRATRGKLKRLFCLEDGKLVHAASNVLEEQFGERLVRRGVLSPRERAEAVGAAGATRRPLASVLLERGNPAPAVLESAMETLVRELLSSTLEWPDGIVLFEPGLPRLDGEIKIRLSPTAEIFAHARRHPATADAVRVRLGPPAVRLASTERADRVLEIAGVAPEARSLVETCDGEIALSEVLASTESEDEALRTLYALLLTGAVDPAARRSPKGVAADAPLSREECAARLASAEGGDFYTVLGVSREASADAVRAAYYALARRYHPDRFRSGDLQDLRPRFEGFFARVTEAYNTLHDPDERAEYDRSLEAPAAKDAPRSDTSHLARQNFLRGRALVATRKLQEALPFLENAVELEEERAEYRLELGLLLSKNPRRRSDAERHLLRAAELAPTAVSAYTTLGHLYLRAGETAAAARMFQEALRWDPGNETAVTGLSESEEAGIVGVDDGPLLRARLPA